MKNAVLVVDCALDDLFIINWQKFDVKKRDLKVKKNLPIVKCADTEEFYLFLDLLEPFLRI